MIAAMLKNCFHFAAIATICDVVPLVDENRIIVSNGLKMLSDRSVMKNTGMRALLDELQIGDKVNSGNIGFRAGPCINAAGRLADASMGMELLLEEDEIAAQKRASGLVMFNEERKAMTERAEEEAYKQASQMDIQNQPVIVVYLKDCHESVAGIVPGMLRENITSLLIY